MIDIIPETVFDYLPFSPEPLPQWDDTTDLLQFLYALYDKSGLMIAEDGTRTPVNYRDYGREVYKRGQESFQVWVQRFTAAAREATPAPGAVIQTIEVPKFSEDSTFGKAAKYIIAWDGVVGEVLSESAFFSIAHVLESDLDLNCSLHLVAHLYYKQALQVLRNFLEDLVLPIHFCDNPDDFLAWKSNDYRVPPLRGRNGILRRLIKQQILSEQIANEISNLYRDLNSYIHGSERRLVHRGLYTGSWMGPVFKYDDFCGWCKYLSQSVDLGVRLLRINLIRWQSIRARGEVLCPICHNDKDFDTERFEFGGEWHIRYHCRQCGNEMTFTAE